MQDDVDTDRRRRHLHDRVQRRRGAGASTTAIRPSSSSPASRWCSRAAGPPTRDVFESDEILVKHDEQYEADNGDRIADAEDGRDRRRADPVNATLGTAGIVLGVAASALGIVTLAWGLRKQRPALLETGWSYSLLVLLGAVVAVIAMQRALITRDFTRELRARQRLHAARRRSSTWRRCGRPSRARSCCGRSSSPASPCTSPGASGSRLSDPLVGTALLVMFVVCLFFFLLVLGPANPFTRVDVPAGLRRARARTRSCRSTSSWRSTRRCSTSATSGSRCRSRSPSPRSPPAASARAGCIETRRATLLAWGFLTIGIILGAWWSYEVLGWGGFWGWDPVENASLLPWLTGTAYLHSVMVQERRGMLRVWNLSLLCATFSLTILGTFLTRSGRARVGARLQRQRHRRAGCSSFFVLIVAVTPRPDRVARRPAALARADRLAGVARGRVPRQQRALRRVRLRGAARHGVPAARGGARTTVPSPSARRTSTA